MAVKLFLSSETILNKVFPASFRGYDSLVVDQYLDTIIKDYQLVEANVIISQKEIDELKAKIDELTKENEKIVIENDKLKTRLGNIKSDDNVTTDNINYIKRINALENYMYKHGLDPRMVK